MRFALLMSAALVLCSAAASFAAPVDYAREIKPILMTKCSSCHGPLKQKAGLRLDAGRLVHAGSKANKVIVPGKAMESLLIGLVTEQDAEKRMPPTGQALSPEQVAVLKQWIDEGAAYPADEVMARTPGEHWSFQALRRPRVPEVKDAAWPSNAIDHFVLAKLESKGWKPNAPAERGALLRRAYLDLTGLPPTLAEQDAHDKEQRGDDFARVIDDLLSRSTYGERYARHWLDVARYADSNGYERDGAKPEVWRYRDYVIRAFNDDKPFDRFILEQLAGDELPDADAQSVTATGFNRLGPWDDEPADYEADRFDQLDDIVNTTGQAFLGLTMGCARCHDHKFDPITHRDYYGMVAVFNGLKRAQSGRSDLSRPAAAPAQMRELERRDRSIAELRGQIKSLRDAALAAHLESGKSRLPAAAIAALRKEEGKRGDEEKRLARENQAALDAELAAATPTGVKQQVVAIEGQIEALRRALPDPAPAYYMYEPSPSIGATHILLRGNPKTPGAEVTPAVPAILVAEQPAFLAPDEFTSRRRLSLARWIAGGENPLTARVIVNRVWQWHFGEGLVRSPNDFGLIGEAPTHPELLDYLAHWFVNDAKWSLKKLHVLIMTSKTYQMSRAQREDYAAIDPENRLLWRQGYRRLEVEAIRDSMLAVSGQLRGDMYGPAVYPFIPAEALANHTDKASVWPRFDEVAASRRTIYAFTKRSLLVPMLDVLDLCDTTRTSPKRNVTTVSTQALTLYNGDFVNRQARHFADRLMKEAGDDPAKQVELAVRLALCRMPTPKERMVMGAFVEGEIAALSETAKAKNESASPAQVHRAALSQLCRVVFNMNEFVYAD
jgi:mono/diheme cytochrome c family protein